MREDTLRPDPPTIDTATIEPDHRSRRSILVVLCLSLSVVMMANGSLNVALPSIADDLGASTSALQWIVDAYALVFAGLLFTAGALGDRFGRKRALEGGLLVFLVAAGLAVLADSVVEVVAARAVMGLAAAFVMPSTLSILTQVFQGRDRPRAIALWAGIAAGGAALGPPISGLLVEHFWWGSVFLVNVPFIAVALLLGRRLLPESKDPDDHPLDVPGALLSILGVGALVYAIIEAPHHGWTSAETAAAFALAGVALVAFVGRELTARTPMLDVRYFRDPRFSVASGGIAAAFFTMFGTFFLMAQLLQLVRGYSPFQSGLVILPMSLTMMVMAPQAPRLAAALGVRRSVPVGLLIVASGLLVLSTATASTSIWQLYAGLLPMSAGMSLTMAPLTSMIMSAVPLGRAGVGSAMNDTTRELGGALGVAVMGSLVTTRYRAEVAPTLEALEPGARHDAELGLSGALRAAAGVPGPDRAAIADGARSAFVDGFGTATTVAAIALALAAVAAGILLPDADPAER